MDEKYLFFYTLGMKVAEANIQAEAQKKVPKKRTREDRIQAALAKTKEDKPFAQWLAAPIETLLPKEYVEAAKAIRKMRMEGKVPADIERVFKAYGAKEVPWYKGGKATKALLRNIALHPRAAGAAGLAALLGGGYGIGKGIEALSD